MRDYVPLRWIEDAEAKQVLTVALFEQGPTPSWCRTGREAVLHWLPRVSAWFAPVSWPMMQPALIRRSSCRRASPPANDSGYSC
jgi:hypothetical protein